MKKIFWFVMLLILITVLLSMIQKIKEEMVLKDYVGWEQQCLKEYEESKDYYIFIDIPQHTMSVFKQGEKIKQYSIATGTLDTPSPVGIWNIVTKSDWGEGFGGQWMGLNVPWGKYGIHGTQKPYSIGHNASHGCIRMYSKDAKELSELIKYGTRVEIYGGELGPFGSRLRTLIPGDRGSDVREVQQVLKKYGYYSGYADGVYGSLMERAVAKLQKDNNLIQDLIIDTRIYKLMGIIPFS